MTLHEIESALHRARRDVFSDDAQVVEKAEQEVRRLRRMLSRHPDEKARRARLEAARNEALLRRWA